MAATPLIRVETEADPARIRAVVAAAFSHQPAVPDLVDMLRRSPGWRPGLSLVAEEADRVVGHVLASRAWLDAPHALVEVLVLSPLSVHPSCQGRGVGTALVRALLDAAARRTEPAVFLEGSPAYYGRFGFEPAGPAGIRRPSLRIPAAAFQVRWLVPRSPELTGSLVYPEAFWVLDCVGLRPQAGRRAGPTPPSPSPVRRARRRGA